MPKQTAGHLAATITIFIWGTTFISTKVLLSDFEPIEILFFRFVIGFAALLVVYPRRIKNTTPKQELLFAGAGLCGVTLYYLLENIALTYTLTSNVGVIISIAPFFTAILAHFLLDGEKPRINFFIGFICALAGIFLISFNGNINLQINPVGDILAVAAALLWACYSILTRKISELGYHTIQTTRKVFFYGLIFMIPALFLFPFRLGFERFENTQNLLNILFLGFGASALCFVTWNFAVKKLGAIKTSIYIYLVPAITIVTSVIVLHERITPVAITGTALTLAGLFISENSRGFMLKR